MKIKLSQWAKNHNVCYKTAWNYYNEGKFEGKCEVSETGSIYIFEDEVKDKIEKEQGLPELIAAIKSLTKAIENK